MAVGRGRLKEALDGIPGGAALTASEIHGEADRLHVDLQELVMKARMEPVVPTFQRFARTVRDLGATLGKSVRLVIEGEDVVSALTMALARKVVRDRIGQWILIIRTWGIRSQ
jgi:two-component system chemotaxis sensor kinase CheA